MKTEPNYTLSTIQDYSRFMVDYYGRPELELNTVTISDMPQSIVDLNEPVEEKHCYNNATNYVLTLIMNGYSFDEVKFVLGYAHSIIPVEHAIVKVGDIYFDPTWQLLGVCGLVDGKRQTEFVVVAELSPGELSNAIELNRMYPPSVSDYLSNPKLRELFNPVFQ